MSPPSRAWWLSPRRPSSDWGITTICTRETKQKTPRVGAIRRGRNTPYPYGLHTADSALERGHHLAREPAQLLLELLGRQALGPMDHEVLEPRILRLDRLDAFDDVRGLAARVAVRLHDVIEDLLPVERHHRLEVLRGHVVDRLAARDRHPDLDGQMLGARHAGDVAERVAAVLDGGRHVVGLAVVAEPLLVEALQHEVHLLLEQLTVGRLVDDGGAEALHLARVVTATDAHDHAAVGDDVRHRVVLG